MSDTELKAVILNVASEFTGKVEVNKHLNYVAVGDFYIQGEEAFKLIEEIEQLSEKMGISIEAAAIFTVDNLM